MDINPENSVKLAAGVTDFLIPALVGLFYDNGDGDVLQKDLQNLVLDKGQEGADANFNDVFRLLDKVETQERFEGLAIVISNVELIGYDDFCHMMEGKRRELAKELVDDPIVQNRISGEISAVLYQQYASFRVMEICIAMVMRVLEGLFEHLPLGDQQYMDEPLANLPLSFSIKLRQISSQEEMIKANLVKFEDLSSS